MYPYDPMFILKMNKIKVHFDLQDSYITLK